MDIEKEIQNILDRNFERGDNAKAKEELLILFDVSNQRELLLSVICEYNKINTQKEIIEVEKWIEKWDIKYKNNQYRIDDEICSKPK